MQRYADTSRRTTTTTVLEKELLLARSALSQALTDSGEWASKYRGAKKEVSALKIENEELKQLVSALKEALGQKLDQLVEVETTKSETLEQLRQARCTIESLKTDNSSLQTQNTALSEAVAELTQKKDVGSVLEAMCPVSDTRVFAPGHMGLPGTLMLTQTTSASLEFILENENPGGAKKRQRSGSVESEEGDKNTDMESVGESKRKDTPQVVEIPLSRITGCRIRTLDDWEPPWGSDYGSGNQGGMPRLLSLLLRGASAGGQRLLRRRSLDLARPAPADPEGDASGRKSSKMAEAALSAGSDAADDGPSRETTQAPARRSESLDLKRAADRKPRSLWNALDAAECNRSHTQATAGEAGEDDGPQRDLAGYNVLEVKYTAATGAAQVSTVQFVLPSADALKYLEAIFRMFPGASSAKRSPPAGKLEDGRSTWLRRLSQPAATPQPLSSSSSMLEASEEEPSREPSATQALAAAVASAVAATVPSLLSPPKDKQHVKQGPAEARPAKGFTSSSLHGPRATHSAATTSSSSSGAGAVPGSGSGGSGGEKLPVMPTFDAISRGGGSLWGPGEVHPKLSVPSMILSEGTAACIASALPSRLHLDDWKLLYSTHRHGISINTFYENVRKHKSTVLIVRDQKGHIFGAFASETWHIDPRYYGTGECMLFTFVPEWKVYRWTQENSYFMLSGTDSLALGGGGSFGLWIDAEFNFGHSGSCATFGSEPLVPSGEFQSEMVEVWGFVPS